MNSQYGSYMTNVAMQAALAAQRAMFKEEEMTHYGDDALSGDWEFKIVRASAGKFRDREEFENLLEQEKEFGWVLLEKLDNSRVRFKRHIKERSRDRMAGVERDPYRSIYGSSSTRRAVLISIGIGLVVITFIVLGAIIFSI